MNSQLDLSGLSPEDRERLEDLFKRLKEGSIAGLSTEELAAIEPSALDIPDAWRPIVRYLRTAPFVGVPGVVGVGLGYRRVGGAETDEIAAVVLVQKKLPRESLKAEHCLPAVVTHDGVSIRVDVQVGFDPFPRLMAAPGVGAFPRATHNCSGAALSLARAQNPCAGGTLTAHLDNRAFTCAHVALGFGIEDFVANLPMSILWLFESPSGADMIASGVLQVGQGLYRLFEVDTGWPLLVPLPIPIPGALGMLFVDGAAGRINPITVPPFVPPGTAATPTSPPFTFATTVPPLAPERMTRFGATIRSARIARPGEGCHKDGQTSGLTWGRVWLPFFQLYLPIPLGFVNTVVLFDTVLCDLVIAPGDSGAAVLADDMHYLAQVSIGLPPPAGSVGGTPQPGVACPVDSNDLISITLGTPYYLHELLLRVDLS